MKYSQLVVLLGAASVSGMKLEKNQRTLFDTSLVMMESAIPVPVTTVVKAAPVSKSVPVVKASSTASAKPTQAAW